MPIANRNTVQAPARHTETSAIIRPNPAIKKIGFGVRKPKSGPMILRDSENSLGPAEYELQRSKLEVWDIPVDMLVDSEENPNEQDEATFDQLTQGVKEEGIDEPVIVMPIVDGENAGKFKIVSGHHRKKTAIVNGIPVVPSVIKKDWTEDKRLVEIVRRNNLKGSLNPEKFIALWNKVTKGGADKSVVKLQMGFTKGDLFDKMFKQVEKNLTPTQKKKLQEAKERVTSVESFSTVLNEIFAEHGSELDHGLVAFKYGEKNKKEVYYVECNEELHKRMKAFQQGIMDRGLFAADVFNHILKNVDLSKIPKSETVANRIAARKTK